MPLRLGWKRCGIHDQSCRKKVKTQTCWISLASKHILSDHKWVHPKSKNTNTKKNYNRCARCTGETCGRHLWGSTCVCRSSTPTSPGNSPHMWHLKLFDFMVFEEMIIFDDMLALFMPFPWPRYLIAQLDGLCWLSWNWQLKKCHKIVT